MVGDNFCSTSDDAVRSTMKRKPIGKLESVTKRSRNNADDEIDADRYCVCFGCFADDAGTGREWIMCLVRDGCIDNENVDIEKSVFCPLY